MFNIFGIDVVESDKVITISGVNGRRLSHVISKTITSKIPKYMFREITTTRITFYKFYVIEVVWALNEVMGVGRLPPTVASEIREVLSLIYRNTWAKMLIQPAKKYVEVGDFKNFTLTPLPHQIDFINKALDRMNRYNLKGYVLSSPPGSGKTMTTLYMAVFKKFGTSTRPIVIGCPNNAVDDPWISTITREMPDKKLWVSKSNTPPPPGYDVYIVHSEYFRKITSYLSTFKGIKTFVILDESHDFNEMTADRTRKLIEFTSIVDLDTIIWSSGTPFKAMGTELIPMLTTFDPLFIPQIAKDFGRLFGSKSSTAISMLASRVGEITYRVEKSDIVSGEPLFDTISVKLKDSDKYTLSNIKTEMRTFVIARAEYYRREMPRYESEYNRCLSVFEKEIEGNTSVEVAYEQYRSDVSLIRSVKNYGEYGVVIVRASKFEEIEIKPRLPQNLKSVFSESKTVVKYPKLKIQGEALGQVLGKKRIDCNKALVEALDIAGILKNSDSKTIVFSNHVSVVEAFAERCRGLKYHPLVVHGETNADLTPMLQRFKTDPKADPVVATFKSLSTARPIVEASQVVFLDQPFRAHVRDQAISRVHRLGQKCQVKVLDVLLDTGVEANISTRSMDIMAWSQEQIDMILGMDSAVSEGSLGETVSLSLVDELDGLSLTGLFKKLTNDRTTRWGI